MNAHTRNIKNGSQFDKVIPPPKDRKVYLGGGDTFNTLQLMRKIVFKTLEDTKQLSGLLQGKTVEDTIKNVKDFLYWHIQYKQDTTEQLLHSPAHTWSVRSSGVDCKSYSIFASSILTNLGIPNSFRQIKQQHFKPKFWSHVYVHVPDQNLVIDGTVKYRYEPPYADKFDEPVLETGLMGLAQLAGCNWREMNLKNNNSSVRGNRNVVSGNRLPSSSLAELLAVTGPHRSIEQVRYGSNDLSVPSDRLRLARAKAKARRRKLLLIKI